MFKKMSYQKFDEIEEETLFERMADFINSQVEIEPYEFVPEKVTALPEVPRNVFFVWWLYCEVGGNGFESYLLQQSGKDAPGAHAGLKAMGATSLLEWLEAAIPISMEWEPDYTESDDLSWFRKFPQNPKFPTIETIDSQEMYAEVGDPLMFKAIEYIMANKNELVE